MRKFEVRNWLGVYFLLTTVAVGGYIMLFGHSRYLPMQKEEAGAALQIVIPLFIGQLTVMFKAFTGPALQDGNAKVDIPIWVIKLPPLLVLGLFVAGVAALILANQQDSGLHFGPSDFKALVTLCISLLNATTIFVITKYFHVATPE
jgi:hypothetical protein